MNIVITIEVGAPFTLRRRVAARVIDLALRLGGIRFTKVVAQ